ncbi:MAG: lipase family protein [Rhodoglobus sp.]
MSGSSARALSAALVLVGAVLLAGCVPQNIPSPTPTATPAAATEPCSGESGVGTAVPAGLGPGDIVSAVDLSDANASSPGFPENARVWRILYVTTGVDETDLQLVCGMVAAPAAGPTSNDGTGQLLNWAHGTVGVEQDCLPSSDPATLFWGAMPGGINAISWGKGLGKHEGAPAGGLLQYAMDEGMVVAAADYHPSDSYIVGKMEGAAVLDAGRAASQLMNQVFSTTAPSNYDSVIWGHSQGGHAALWAGQLAETYLAKTQPSHSTPPITLVGVAAMAPASNFITQPGQSGVAFGDGLADWEMHKNVGVALAIDSLQMQIGPALFSYIFGSWDALASGPAPAADAAFPAYPTNVAVPSLSEVVTDDPGAKTVATVSSLCLANAQAKQVRADVEKYEDAATSQMLVAPVWNLPAKYTTGEYFKGGLDQSCASSQGTSLASWCEWMRFNLPGPLGSSAYPKVSTVAGVTVPLFITQGTNDDVMHCQVAPGASADEVPAAADCMSRALYESFLPAYCPESGTPGHLELQAVREEGVDGIVSAASHLSLPGEISARDISGNAADLVFTGSPLQKFISAAFAHTTASGCSVSVIN